MELCLDLKGLIWDYLEPNVGSIIHFWLTYAKTTKSKAKFAKHLRLHIPSCKILWLDLYMVRSRQGRFLHMTTTCWVSEQRPNTFDHSRTTTDVWSSGKVNKRNLTVEEIISNIGQGVTAGTAVDLSFGHWNCFWRKPHEKALLGISRMPERTKEAVLETKIIV